MPAPLREGQATRALKAVDEELGVTDRGRLAELVGLLKGGDCRLRLSEALTLLFPAFAEEGALVRFRKLKYRLRQAAEASGVELKLAMDSDKRSPSAERWCWFEGENLAAKLEAERLSRDEALGGQPMEAISQKALVPVEMRDGKAVLCYFVSYAHEDDRLKKDLLKRLEFRFKNSPEFVFEGWHDGDIAAGDNWKEEVRCAVHRCHFGLLLISHEFLSSAFITREELPHFLPNRGAPVAWRRAIPVGLKRVPFDGSADLRGLSKLQVFRHEGCWYSQRRASHTRDAFADELFQQILAVARKHVVGPGSLKPPGRGI